MNASILRKVYSNPRTILCENKTKQKQRIAPHTKDKTKIGVVYSRNIQKTKERMETFSKGSVTLSITSKSVVLRKGVLNFQTNDGILIANKPKEMQVSTFYDVAKQNILECSSVLRNRK